MGLVAWVGAAWRRALAPAALVAARCGGARRKEMSVTRRGIRKAPAWERA